jgi:hypothetical protein
VAGPIIERGPRESTPPAIACGKAPRVVL